MDTTELLKEFEDLYKNQQEIPDWIGAIIILAGDRPPMQGENLSRIKYAATILKQFRKNIPIIFSGLTGEKGASINLMISLGIPKETCHFQDCGELGVTNTKIQFETLVTDPLIKNLGNLVFVTNSYHIPRVKRTAGKIFPLETNFVVIGDPEDWKTYNSFMNIMDEIKKIIEYSAKGDILERPR